MTGKPVEISPSYFYDGSFEYQHFDRVGGVLSHLRKVHRNHIQQHLGVERTLELLEDDRLIVRVADVCKWKMRQKIPNENYCLMGI